MENFYLVKDSQKQVTKHASKKKHRDSQRRYAAKKKKRQDLLDEKSIITKYISS